MSYHPPLFVIVYCVLLALCLIFIPQIIKNSFLCIGETPSMLMSVHCIITLLDYFLDINFQLKISLSTCVSSPNVTSISVPA